MTIDKVFKYWTRLSDEKWKTAQALMKSKRYADALFFCHLRLEAILKGRVVLNTRKPVPYIHDLSKLANISGLDFNKDHVGTLDEITTFNIKGRYDNYKYNFYKKATKAYAKKYFEITKELRLWAKKNIQKKK
jgi:HEPN domain-containing protein